MLKILKWNLWRWKIVLITPNVLVPCFRNTSLDQYRHTAVSLRFLQLPFPIAKLHSKFTTKEWKVWTKNPIYHCLISYNYSYPSHIQYLLHVCLKNSKSLIESRGQSWNIRSCDIRQVQLWFIVILRPVTSKDTQYLPRANPTYSDEADRNTTTKILEKEINGRCIGGIGPWQFWKLGKCCPVPLTSEKECSMIYLTLVLLFGRSYTGRCSLLLLAPYSWRFFF